MNSYLAPPRFIINGCFSHPFEHISAPPPAYSSINEEKVQQEIQRMNPFILECEWVARELRSLLPNVRLNYRNLQKEIRKRSTKQSVQMPEYVLAKLLLGLVMRERAAVKALETNVDQVETESFIIGE